jgi:hypothetical protein
MAQRAGMLARAGLKGESEWHLLVKYCAAAEVTSRAV